MLTALCLWGVPRRNVEVLWSDAAVAVLTDRQDKYRKTRDIVQIHSPKDLQDLENGGEQSSMQPLSRDDCC